MGEQEVARFTGADVRAVFLRWEKLRILYNLIVGALGLLAILVLSALNGLWYDLP